MSGQQAMSGQNESKKCGLVMEGGAMRGLFTCGVIDVLMEQGISFDGAVGTSAGATFGCNIKSHQIGRPLRYNLRFSRDKRYSSISSLLRTGDLYNAEFCYHDLPYFYDIWDEEAFREDPMEFYVVATDVLTGRPVYYHCKNGGERDILWIRASASMPLAARIVEIDGRKLLDGGIADSIALRFMQRIGYDKNVVIMTRPKGYRRGPNRLIPVLRLVYHNYPRFVEAMESRHLRYNACVRYIEQEEECGRAVIIRPSQPLDLKKTEKDPVKLKIAYEQGRSEALRSIDRIKEQGFCRINA